MLLGWFLGVGLRFAAVAGTMVPWKGWEAGGSGAGGFLVVGLQFAAVGGTGVGDFCVVIIVADGWCRGVVSLGAVGCITVVLLPWKGEGGGARGLLKGGEVERLKG